MKIVAVHDNRIIQRPYTLTLQHGDYVNNGTRVVLDPLHQCDARDVPHGEFEFGVQLDANYQFDHPQKPDHLISQWRQSGSPYLSLHHAGREWYCKAGFDRYDLGLATPLRTDFRFQIVWSTGKDGKLLIERDGQEYVNERRQTMESDDKVHWTVCDYRPWWNANEPHNGEPAYNQINVWV